MKKSVIVVLLSIFSLYGCNSDDNEIISLSLNGETYELSSYNIETPVDLNNDGVFSLNLLEEGVGECLVRELNFDDSQLNHPFSETLFFDINDTNGEIRQGFGCEFLLFGFETTYTLEDDILTIFTGNTIQANGIITDDKITLSLLPEFVFTISQILKEDGNVENYRRTVTAIYQRI